MVRHMKRSSFGSTEASTHHGNARPAQAENGYPEEQPLEWLERIETWQQDLSTVIRELAQGLGQLREQVGQQARALKHNEQVVSELMAENARLVEWTSHAGRQVETLEARVRQLEEPLPNFQPEHRLTQERVVPEPVKREPSKRKPFNRRYTALAFVLFVLAGIAMGSAVVLFFKQQDQVTVSPLDGPKAPERSSLPAKEPLEASPNTLFIKDGEAPMQVNPRADQPRKLEQGPMVRDPSTPAPAPDAPFGAAKSAKDTRSQAVRERIVQASQEIPHLRVHNVSGNEDEAIPLDIAVDLPPSEHALSVEIRGLPAEARLSAGTQGNGWWRLSPADLEELTVTPPRDSDEDLRLSVRLVEEAGKTVTQAAGTVTVNAVADTPALAVRVADGDQYTAIPIEIHVASSDRDGSETLAIFISGIPETAKLSAGKQRPDGVWILSAHQLPGLILTPQANSPSKIELRVTAVATESSNGDTSSTSRIVKFRVFPADQPH